MGKTFRKGFVTILLGGDVVDLIKIGKFLAGLRHEQGYTQEKLGERLGVTNKTISRFGNGCLPSAG